MLCIAVNKYIQKYGVQTYNEKELLLENNAIMCITLFRSDLIKAIKLIRRELDVHARQLTWKHVYESMMPYITIKTGQRKTNQTKECVLLMTCITDFDFVAYS